MRIQTGVLLGVSLVLAGCVGAVPWEGKETVRIDVTGPALESNQKEADMRCYKYDEQVALLKDSRAEGPGVRHDVFECAPPGKAGRD